MKRIIFISAIALASIALLSGCGGSKQSSDSGGKTKITFWASPNPTQFQFWKSMAKDFEKKNPEITVNVTQMKESPSSEATIQSAIASKTAPTMSENINRSFAAQLADSKAILPLNKQSGFNGIVKERNMVKTIGSWQFSDGSQYVLPMYSNPILFAWRLDTLKGLGINQVPKTYSELEHVAQIIKEKKIDKVVWAKKDIGDTTAWMRWFDFFPLYNAASRGGSFVSDGKFNANFPAVEGVFGLMSSLAKSGALLTGAATDPFENGVSVMTDIGPWMFPIWSEKYPELKFGENYTVTAPVVPDAMSDNKGASTYADAKGIVMYAQATKQEQKAAMSFVNFVFSDEQNDLKWLEKTSLIPARDDATTNVTFENYFSKNPQMKVFGEYVPSAVPAMDNGKYNDIQQVFGEKSWVPIVRGEKTPEKALADAKSAIKGALQ
ncbi:MAG: extracellular solute-binding protein [Streptococcus sp.]|nr:extracellular solute-binding protein [Streptococcus sp.]